MTVSACPVCSLVPPYRRVPADPWDRHEVCISCGYCYTHDAYDRHKAPKFFMGKSPARPAKKIFKRTGTEQ